MKSAARETACRQSSAGALQESVYPQQLNAAGFTAIDVQPTRNYQLKEARESLAGAGLNVDEIAPQVEDKFLSAFIRAQKPAANCCGP
jgi:hypothetical protein